MNVEIKFFTSLREITGQKVDKIQLQNSITVNELLGLLCKKYGNKFIEYIYKKPQQVQPFLSFLINGKNINNIQGFETKLQDGDVIAILPPIGGG